MNTLNGNFIERSIPNIKNATLNLLIGDQAATMNLADFQTAILSSYSFSKGLKMKDDLPLSSTLNTVVDSNETITESPLQLSTTQVAMLGDTFFGASSATTNILTLQSTTRNQIKVTNGSTFEIWRSAGVESARFDSNGNFALGTTSASSRLHVRGDGTNPIMRLDSSAGTLVYSITQDGYLNGLNGSKIGAYDASSGAFTLYATNVLDSLSRFEFWNGTTPSLRMTLHNGAAFSSGTNTRSILNLNYTINNTGGTNTINGFLLNATETSITGTTHNLMDLQVGGVSKFLVNRLGGFTSSTGIIANVIIDGNLYPTTSNGSFSMFSDGAANGQVTIYGNTNPTVALRNNILLSPASLIYLKGTTASFPAIKRNGANIDFRVADDSAFCDVQCQNIAFGQQTSTTNIGNNLQSNFGIGFRIGNAGMMIGGNSTLNTSCLLELISTTKGFLMPRMTQAQILAIVSPANGLMVYNTDINTPCFYDGGVLLWKKVSHSNM